MEGNIQRNTHSLSLGRLDSCDLGARVGFALLITRVPMNVFVFLPSSRRCVDTVTKIVLRIVREHVVQRKRGRHTSRSLSADTSLHLNSAWPPRVPPRVGSNILDCCERPRYQYRFKIRGWRCRRARRRRGGCGHVCVVSVDSRDDHDLGALLEAETCPRILALYIHIRPKYLCANTQTPLKWWTAWFTMLTAARRSWYYGLRIT
jgi:hypothetical protein